MVYASYWESSDMKSRKMISEEKFPVVMQGLEGGKDVYKRQIVLGVMRLYVIVSSGRKIIWSVYVRYIFVKQLRSKQIYALKRHSLSRTYERSWYYFPNSVTSAGVMEEF